MTVGIVAFGSLLDEPGAELEARIARRIEGIETPFAVEFARSSRTRDGAPTLVPVRVGGAPLPAAVLILDEAVDEQLARDLLYRRETWQVGACVGEPAAGVDWIRDCLPSPAFAFACTRRSRRTSSR